MNWDNNSTARCPLESLFVGPDGTLYATWITSVSVVGGFSSCGANGLFALSPANGSVEWNVSGVKYLAIGNDGTLYTSPSLALNPNGSVKWNVTSNLEKCGGIASNPVIGADGTIYTGGSNGTVCAISLDGTLKWEETLPASADGSPVTNLAIGKSGTLYVETQNGWIYAYD